MQYSFIHHRRATLGLALGLLMALPAGARAQLAPGMFGTDQPTTRPLFQELNRESQSLFNEIAASIVRVQIPAGPEAMVNDPLSRWADQLDPETRRKLEEIERHAPQNPYVRAEIQPTTKASDGAAEGPHEIIIQLSRFTPNAIGIIVDAQQNLVIPHFVDQAAFDRPIPVELGDGRMALASFVASDHLADLTVLRLVGGVKGKIASVAPSKLEDGTLLLVMSLNPAFNRLAVWQGWEPDFAVLVSIDARIAGFTKGGHFISASAFQPAIRELIDHGAVRRAVLGVRIMTVPADDPRRLTDPALGTTPAIVVKEVGQGSAAELGGLQAGDLILTLGGQSVGDAPSFAAAIANRRGKTDLLVLRDSHRIHITVDLQVQ